MTTAEKQAELEKYTIIWQKAGDYIDQLRKEINQEETPVKTSDEIKIELDSIVTIKEVTKQEANEGTYKSGI